MNKFWNWIKNGLEDNPTILLYGAIGGNDTWFDDDVTPKQFKAELAACNGADITVKINSPGGDVFAAAEIYTALKEYKGGVEVEVDALAASSASVIAMAGDIVSISPAGMLMIHNPVTIAIGDADEMKTAAHTLDEIKESIINAYELKTKLPRDKISKLMDAETWFNARKAQEMGFVDEILFTEDDAEKSADDALIFSRAAITNCFLDKIKAKKQIKGVDATHFYKRLNLISLKGMNK